MGKPRMIILIRHAQSEGNKNRDIHQTVPDHRVKLTPEGHKQALEAGHRLRALLRPDDTIHFFTSPYRRTRETTEGILASLTSDDPSPSPFPRHTIKVYEEPRLREQDFGNFQPCSAEMERMWQERADYGHFFYRIPNGESAADAYDRVSGFNESLWRLFGEDDFASVCVLVTHGLMTRVFLMKWYHFSVEYFEDLRNINHCEFVIMEKNKDNEKYILQTKLRTWSELKKERDLEKKRERAVKGLSPGLSTLATGTTTTPTEASIPIRRKWGGCPDGCNHGLTMRSRTGRRPTRRDTYDMFRDDDRDDSSATQTQRTHLRLELPPTTTHTAPSNHDNSPRSEAPHTSQKPHGRVAPDKIAVPAVKSDPQVSVTAIVDKSGSIEALIGFNHSRPSNREQLEKPAREIPEKIAFTSDEDVTDSLKVDSFLRFGGRDGGGSKSGVNSLAPSDEEEAEKQNINTNQEVDEDGDDEGKRAKPRSRRSKHHSHGHRGHSLNHNPPGVSPAHGSPFSPRMANILGDGDSEEDADAEASVPSSSSPPTTTSSITTRDSLDEARERDQNLRSSVY